MKTLRIVQDNESGKVDAAIRLNAAQGRSIYVFELNSGDYVRIDKPSDAVWSQYAQMGIQVAYPVKPPAIKDDPLFWVDHAKAEAVKRNLDTV